MLEKQQIKLEEGCRRAEIYEIENKCTVEKINKAKNWFFENLFLPGTCHFY